MDRKAIIEKTASFPSRQDSSIYTPTTTDEFATKIWRKYATGESTAALLERSLENDGVSLAEVTAGIELTDLSAAIHQQDNAWIEVSASIFEIYRKHPAPDPLKFNDKTITRIALLPFSEYLQERIIAHSDSVAGPISKNALIAYAQMILEHLAFIADDTLLTLARTFEQSFEVPYWRVTPVDERGASFLSWFYSEGIVTLFHTYPLLVKKIIALLDNHYSNFRSFLTGFLRDRRTIADTFGFNYDSLTISEISGNLSDVHNKGKTVIRMEFNSGDCLYYKPRSMAVDCAWRAFVDKLVSSAYPLRLYAPKVLDRGEYGYVEEIKYHGDVSEEEAKLYFRNAGGLCCIVSMLGGTDFHHENIIAQHTIPVLVDVETLITPKPAPFYGLAELNKEDGASTHVGRTLMLQHWVGNSPDAARDIGGFTSEHSDDHNIPTVSNRPKKGAEFYIQDFLSGFDTAYDYFLSHKTTILQEKWLDVFSPCQFRYVFRRTALYYSLIKHFYSAPFMRNLLYFEGAISRFGAGILLNFNQDDAKRLWNIVLAEKESARYADIPYFICRGDSQDLLSQDGACVKDFFVSTPVELALQNLEAMTPENKQREIRYIQLDLDTCHTQKQFSDKTPILSYQNMIRHVSSSASNPEPLIHKELERLMAVINCFELPESNFEYYAPVRNRKNTRYNIEVLPTDLYSGSLGVLVTQAAYANLTGNQCLKAKVLDKFASIYSEEINTGRSVSSLNLCYTQGLAGFVQAALIVGQLLDEFELHKLALNAIYSIPEEHIKRTAEFDFFSGLSGALYYFSKVYHIFPEERLKEILLRLSRELMSRASVEEQGNTIWRTPSEHQPIVGLAHGQCGIALALLEAWKITGDTHLYQIAQSLFDYESGCYSPTENNWFDFRKFNVSLRGFTAGEAYRPRFMYGYCSGTPGIGISRLIAARQTGSNQFEPDIQRAIKFCSNSTIIGNDSLCCGSGAWIDLLIESALHFDDPTLLARAKALCVAIIPEISGNDYILSNLNGTADISLFKGYSGVAYQFMRTLKPTEIPSILI